MATADAQNSDASTLSARVGAAWQRFWFTPSDPLPIAALRILTGLMAFYTLATYTPDLVRFFGADGLVPVETIRKLRGDFPGWSPLELLSSASELYTAHALALTAATLMTVGLWTRLSTPLTLVAVLAYTHRGLMLTSQLEPILTFLLFYLCFAPAGRWLSLDAWWARRKLTDRPVQLAEWDRGRTESVGATIVTRLLQIHIAMVYLLMAVAKINDGVAVTGADSEIYWAWNSGEAVWWLAAKPQWRLVDLTPVLTSNQYLVNAWTHAIVLFELTMAACIWVRPLRPVLLVLSVVMWTSLALITGLMPFCLMMLAANVVFVSPSVLRDWIGRLHAA